MTSPDLKSDIIVIGAGVLGLATAAALSRRSGDLIVLEAHPSFGCETSSRNSEVVHSGIYYPSDSLKTALCLRGRELLYEVCERHAIPFRKTGKLVVSTEEGESEYLDRLESHARSVDVPVERRTSSAVAAVEPLVSVRDGLFFPESGIVDSHQLMAHLERTAIHNGAIMAYRHRLTTIERTGEAWRVVVETPDGPAEIVAGHVINCAGLAAAEIATQVTGSPRYHHRFCRGRYFALGGRYTGRFRHLVYPVPQTDGLGVHVTIDLGGTARLGPDVDWIDEPTYGSLSPYYQCDWETLREPFFRAAARYLPALAITDLDPGLIGIRAKLFVDDKAHRDFVIESHAGSLHCLGFESPGLTAALAAAERIASLVG